MDKQRTFESLMAKAKNQQVISSFDETRERFLHSLHSAGESTVKNQKTNRINSLKSILMITVISSIALTILFIFCNEATPSAPPPAVPVVSTIAEQAPGNPPAQAVPKIPQPIHKSGSSPATDPLLTDPLTAFADSFPSLRISPQPVVRYNLQPPAGASNDPYIFPKLTDEEIKKTIKTKRQMFKALEKHDKKSWAYIPSGTFYVRNDTISVQAFYMETTEITNLEYRTFLFDLLIQGRNDEFLKAKPDQSQWVAVYGQNMQPMTDHYFSHPAYDNYPVCNVSKEGAELYCKWFTQEYNKTYGTKGNINDLRLPSRNEWLYAASAGGKHMKYPWDGEFPRNSAGCYLANFCPETDSSMLDGAFFTASVRSYTASEFGLYNMSGNVAEMVYETDNSRGTTGTAGGDWLSSEKEIQLLGPDKYGNNASPHPNIGFRVVITYLNSH